MPTFSYIAKDRSGSEVKGRLDADSRKQALRLLGGQDLLPIRLQEGDAATGSRKTPGSGGLRALFSSGSTNSTRSLGRSAMLPFLRALADLTSCGIQVADGVRLLSRRLRNPKIKGLAQSVWEQLSQGKSLSAAMEAHRKIFDEAAISLIEAGEATGNLSVILERLVANLEERKEIRGKVVAALVYPVFLVLVSIAVVLGFIFFMLPKIQSLLTSMGSHLPLITRLLIGFSHGVIIYGPFVLLGVTLIAVSLWTWRRTESGRLWFDSAVLRIWLIGTFLRDTDMLRLSQTLGLLLENGITMISALAMTERTVLNRIIRRSFNEARLKIAEGTAVSSAFDATGYFPDMVIDILTVGDNTGNIVPSLREVSRYYSKRQEKQVNAFMGSISVVVLLFAFGFVAMIAVGIVLSVLQMSSSMSAY